MGRSPNSHELRGHIRSKSNPHDIKPEQAGAYALDGREALTAALNLGLLSQSFVVVLQSSPPPNPSTGWIYPDDGSNSANGKPTFFYYDGAAWQPMGNNIFTTHDHRFPVLTGYGNQVKHADLSGLTTGDPHTQYLERAGDNLTGNVTADAGVTVDGVDLSNNVAGYSQGTLYQTCSILAGAINPGGASSKQVTLPISYTSSATYIPLAIASGTGTSPYVTQVTANSANTFTIYLSGTYSSPVYWLTFGR